MPDMARKTTRPVTSSVTSVTSSVTSSVGPRLSLSETTDLISELETWSQMLSQSTVSLSVVQPQFYLAVNNVIQFISGAVGKLSRQRH